MRLLCPDTDQSVQRVEIAVPLKKYRRRRRDIPNGLNATDYLPRPARIFVQEMLSEHTLSMFWSDPRTGHYSDQIWRLGFARIDGFCALSGKPIAEGDQIFRPLRSLMRAPSNGDRMVLASVVSMQVGDDD
ncbi:DUF3331 domain-containing protein [Paraburkholderia hospita]|nr:DUF3331 domain-containing protein [Paraburkholderia hospita]